MAKSSTINGDSCTQWQSIEAPNSKLPTKTIVLVWCGTWLSSPQNFLTQQIADSYKADNGAVAFIRIPDARACLKGK